MAPPVQAAAYTLLRDVNALAAGEAAAASATDGFTEPLHEPFRAVRQSQSRQWTDVLRDLFVAKR